MFTFEEIYDAYKDCRKNKRYTTNAYRFECDLMSNLWSLHEQLNNKTYSPGTSICFVVNSPKMREIFAADFRDRVVHHLLVKRLYNFYDRKFIHDNYNNRYGKGIHSAVKRAKSFMRSDMGGYYLQLDIRNFFYSINKQILYNILQKDISASGLKNKFELLWLISRIVFHDPVKDCCIKGDKSILDKMPPHKTLFKVPNGFGIPVGNLTSQYFANVYMYQFDNYVKRVLKVKHYIRYVDDFVLFHLERDYLEDISQKIAGYLKVMLGLKLRDEIKLNRFTSGLDFLGYVVRPDYILVRNRVVNNYKCSKAQHLDKYEKMKGKMTREEILKFNSKIASFKGHCIHADSYRLLKTIGEIDEKDPFSYDD